MADEAIEANATQQAESGVSRPTRARTLIAIAAVLVLVGGAGVAGYVYGKSTGEDLDAARKAGVTEGTAEGSARGAEKGFAQGFEEGRSEAFDKAYADAYETAYLEAFNQADLKEPGSVPDPESQQTAN